jgi:hypothetical protein
MPLPLAALVALSLGALFAHVARAELTQTDAPIVSSRAMAIVVAFAGFVVLPAVAYFAAFHGDWAYMYFIAWRRVPSAIDLAVVLACAALVPAGFLLVAPLARAKRREVVMAMIAGPAALAALLALVLQHRVGTSATFAQFKLGEGVQPIARAALGRAVLVAIAIATGAALWAVRLLRSTPLPTPKAGFDGSKRWR